MSLEALFNRELGLCPLRRCEQIVDPTLHRCGAFPGVDCPFRFDRCAWVFIMGRSGWVWILRRRDLKSPAFDAADRPPFQASTVADRFRLWLSSVLRCVFCFAGFVAERLAIICSSVADSIVLRASVVAEGFGFLVIRSRYPPTPDCHFVHALYLAGRVI